jgi:hypothetical protein
MTINWMRPPNEHRQNTKERWLMPDSLSVSVFNSGYKKIQGGPGWDPATQATWPASTSTLIAGDQDAILVDALITTSEGQRLAD